MIRIVIGVMAVMLSPMWQWQSVAGELMTLRLVEASNAGEGVTAEVKDVASILAAQLPFNSYRLVDRAKCKLPANQVVSMSRGYTVQCIGVQDNLTINVRERKSEILQTTVALKDGKPLVLGGFPSNKGKLLLILLAE